MLLKDYNEKRDKVILKFKSEVDTLVNATYTNCTKDEKRELKSVGYLALAEYTNKYFLRERGEFNTDVFAGLAFEKFSEAIEKEYEKMGYKKSNEFNFTEVRLGISSHNAQI